MGGVQRAAPKRKAIAPGVSKGRLREGTFWLYEKIGYVMVLDEPPDMESARILFDEDGNIH